MLWGVLDTLGVCLVPAWGLILRELLLRGDPALLRLMPAGTLTPVRRSLRDALLCLLDDDVLCLV